MEQPYLTRLNNLAAAWPSVYNRIDKHRVQVMKFQRELQGGTSSSPAVRVRAHSEDRPVCTCLCALSFRRVSLLLSPEKPVYLCGSLHSHLMYLYMFKSVAVPFRVYDSPTELKESE